MEKKVFLVTNRGEGSITLVGHSRINIPGGCQNFPISLSAEKAQAIVSRLKRTYPLLKIVEDTVKDRQVETSVTPEPQQIPLSSIPEASDTQDEAQNIPTSHANTKKKG